jgi:hypothetical protein
MLTETDRNDIESVKWTEQFQCCSGTRNIIVMSEMVLLLTEIVSKFMTRVTTKMTAAVGKQCRLSGRLIRSCELYFLYSCSYFMSVSFFCSVLPLIICYEWYTLGAKKGRRLLAEQGSFLSAPSKCHVRTISSKVRFEVFMAVTMKNAIFWNINNRFVLHRRHITSQLQSSAG